MNTPHIALNAVEIKPPTAHCKIWIAQGILPGVGTVTATGEDERAAVLALNEATERNIIREAQRARTTPITRTHED